MSQRARSGANSVGDQEASVDLLRAGWSATVVADGLGYPEGPVVLDDGRLLVADQYGGRIVAVEAIESTTVVIEVGSNPNGLAQGCDGRVWVCRGNGRLGAWRYPDPRPPAILAVDLNDYTIEVVLTEVEGIKLRAPNDLCFGPDGTLYFSDPGDFATADRATGIICRYRDGQASIVRSLPGEYPNGVAIDRHGRLSWTESKSGRIMRADADGDEVLATLSGPAVPDGCAWSAEQVLLVATLDSGGIHMIEPQGTRKVRLLKWGADVCATNVAVDGATLYVTDATRDWQQLTPPKGRVWRLDPPGGEPQLVV